MRVSRNEIASCSTKYPRDGRRLFVQIETGHRVIIEQRKSIRLAYRKLEKNVGAHAAKFSKECFLVVKN
jgi:hypothetical protein